MPAAAITAPNLLRASRVAADTIALEFDQPIRWDDALVGQFFLDGQKGLVAGGAVAGNVLTLRSKGPSAAKTITYLKESSWNPDAILEGTNRIAALTFCDVPIDTGATDDAPRR